MAEKVDEITRDPRVDRAMRFFMALCITVALSVGAYFFRDLKVSFGEKVDTLGSQVTEFGKSVKGLDESIDQLQVELALMSKEAEEIAEIRAELRSVRDYATNHTGEKGHVAAWTKINEFERRISSMEARLTELEKK